MRVIRRLLGAVMAVATIYCAAAGLPPSLPVRIPGSSTLGVAQILAFPAAVLAFCGFAVLVWGATAVRARSRSARLVAALLALVALLGAVLWADVVPRPRVDSAGTRLSLVTWNTEGSLRAQDLAELMREANPDVVVLPETSRASLEAAVNGAPGDLGLADYDRWTSGTTGETAPVSVLARRSLGYTAVAAPAATYGALTLTSASAPTVVAAHPAPPVPELMGAWRDDVPRLLDAVGCGQRDPAPAILAGDLNSTLQHGTLARLGSCTDAQHAVGKRWNHTWPTNAPVWLGSTIDHVVTTPGVRAESVTVTRYAVSDHRAVWALLRY